jgi:hypothetical protein
MWLDPELITTDGAKFGYINTPSGACYIQRLPLRSMLKGLCSRNIKSTRGSAVSLPLNEDSAVTYYNLFNPTYYTFDEALHELEEGRRMAALSKDVVLALMDRKVVVRYKYKDIGMVSDRHLRLYPEFSRLDSAMMRLGMELTN